MSGAVYPDCIFLRERFDGRLSNEWETEPPVKGVAYMRMDVADRAADMRVERLAVLLREVLSENSNISNDLDWRISAEVG